MLEAMGEVRRFDGVDLNLEVGALTERAAEQEGPALLFNRFEGFPAGYRVVSNLFRTCKRTGPAMGIAPELNGIEYLYAWRKRLADFQRVPVQEQESGPVLENQMADDTVDLFQ